MAGRFITLEGLDGAGKSTQLASIVGFLERRGIDVRVTREPGGTAFGESLRALVLEGQRALHPETETLLMFAARREHIDKVIAPAIASGTWIVCDRFTDATFAYQGGGSGVGWNKIEALERWVQGTLAPDLTLYFDLSPEVALGRVTSIKSPDRYEQESSAFHARTRAAYLRRARESAARVRVIDADRPIDAVSCEVEALLEAFCERSGICNR